MENNITKKQNAFISEEEKTLNWEEIQNAFKKTFGSEVYDSWLQKISLVKEYNDYLVLGVPTRFFRDWIVSRYLDKILEQVKIFNLAVSNSDDPIKLFINNDESGHSMFSQSSQNLMVDSISLKKIFDDNKIEHCNFLKLDCEGAEYEIIKNLPLSYFEKIDKIIIEYHMADSNPQLLIELKKILVDQNFKIETKSLFSNIGFLYAKKL